jgi:3-dehydroquinate synthase
MENIHFFSDGESLTAHLSDIQKKYSKVFVLDDENTQQCLKGIDSCLSDAHYIQIKSGELHKTLDTCAYIWTRLTEGLADRKSLLLNLGGGVITDMGGFAAACYKRGIDFVHIPTTLLTMVDAAIGGKTGIDFEGYKNHIGLFSPATEVLIYPGFLGTLDKREIRSGLAEVVKHYLIADAGVFHTLSSVRSYEEVPIDLALIKRATEIKSAIVSQDPYEKNIRKALNLGHTVGHALESYYIGTDQALLHGEAIAMGIVVEAIIAMRKNILPEIQAQMIIDTMKVLFPLRAIPEPIVPDLMALIHHDKKNDRGIILLTLLTDIGSYRIDVPTDADEIIIAIKKYNTLLLQ